MADLGAMFRDAVVEYINSWNQNIETLIEVNVGARFIGTPRRIDIVIRNKDNNKYKLTQKDWDVLRPGNDEEKASKIVKKTFSPNVIVE